MIDLKSQVAASLRRARYLVDFPQDETAQVAAIVVEDLLKLNVLIEEGRVLSVVETNCQGLGADGTVQYDVWTEPEED